MLFSLSQYSCVELDYPFFIYTVTNSKTKIIVLGSFWIFKKASSSLDDCDNINSGAIIQAILKPTGQKSVGPDGMHKRVLMDLANFTMSPLSLIWKVMAAGHVLSEWEKTNITPALEKEKKNLDRLANLPSVSGKVMVQIFPDTFSNHIK